MSLILTDEEIAEYTKRDKPAWQARVLRALGVPFVPHPFDGNLLVDREAARSVLGVLPKSPAGAPPEVNVAAVKALKDRRHAAKKGSPR